MQAGKLDRVVSFERLSETVGTTGAVSTTWDPFAVVRASVTDATQEEIEGGKGEHLKVRITVLMRYRDDISLSDRLTYEGRAFNIVSMVEIGRRKGLELRAVAP